jgi:hypothetical protein
MKKALAALLLIALISVGITPVMAFEGLAAYSVALTTYVPTAYDPAVTVAPFVAGGVRIHKIIITSDDVTAAQKITFYENATSTTATTASWAIDIDSVTAVGGGQYPIQIDYAGGSQYWFATNMLARKSSTSSTVTMTIFYK